MTLAAKVCAVVAAPSSREMQWQFGRAQSQTNWLELRLDWLSRDAEIVRFLKWLALRRPGRATLLATCRRVQAGGRYKGAIANQLVHLAAAIRAGCQWYDLELETASLCPPELLDVLLGDGCQIVSAHFFEKLPPHLPRVSTQLRRTNPDAIKIAAHCHSLADGLKLVRFGRERRNVIVIPMGEIAKPLRLLSAREAGGFTYAPVENATAPGQASLDETLRLYRANKITRRTAVYGVIGNPIGHSLSPLMQNAAFHSHRTNAVYLPFLVRDLRDFVNALRPLGMRGFSVTIPHKQAILRFLDHCEPLARKIGAVNTVAIRGGKLYGYNTDYVGVLRALQRRISLENSRVLILGAGGAARAVAFALSAARASISVWARRSEQAAALARAAGGQALDRQQLRSEFFDAIVNATPVGMHPHAGASPLAANELNCRLVFDTIYRPRDTKLLQLARARGIQTVSGVDMFVAQGAAQFEIWTGRRAPESLMRRAVSRALDQEAKPLRRGRPGRKQKAKQSPKK